MTHGGAASQHTEYRERIGLALLVIIVLCGAFLRVYGLGSRSLWADEFCTWHVSRMELGGSLRWGPELTKPPLYQLCLRAISYEPRPPEWVLRLPACVAGVLTILAVFALGHCGGGMITGLAAAGLVAFNLSNIHYSQEARSYSMLVLGSTFATMLWHGLVRKPTRSLLCAYVAVAAVTFHANYLMSTVIFAHGLWWVLSLRKRFHDRNQFAPLAALVITGVICAPIVFHYLRWRSSIFQGLSWIKPPTWGDALAVLERITFGPIWVVVILTPGLVVWVVAGARRTRARRSATLRDQRIACQSEPAKAGEESGPFAALRVTSWDRCNLCGLLAAWLFCSWFGLLVISWVAHPAMVERYALPAGVPAILLPLIVAHRLNHRLPVVILLVFAALGLREWTQTRLEAEPGFRELSHYLAETVDPKKDAIVLTIDRKTHPDWDDAERLAFQYYPVRDYPIEELHLAPDGVTAMNEILRDPQGMYLVVLWADPFAILEAAGRKTELFSIEGQTYTQLLFSPYRLVRVKAME